MNKYAKTALKLFVAIPISLLPTNFQLNIFIFEARVDLQTLLQSLKQNASEFLWQIFKLILFEEICQNCIIVTCNNAQQKAIYEFSSQYLNL